MAGLELTSIQWTLGVLAALMVGISKTGLPGAGILVVPLMATIFSGRTSPGALLPMLILGDFFAVGWYRQHAQWRLLTGLAVWVAIGLAIGAALLQYVGAHPGMGKQIEQLIAVIVLAMLALHLLRKRLGERFQPHSKAGRGVTGVAAGFATTVSNAAGPIMSMYMASAEIPKEAFMGTSAWYYIIVNCAKVPVFVALTLAAPKEPMIDGRTLAFNLLVAPVIILGVYIGRWMLHRISQNAFEAVVLVLAAIAALKLLFA